MAGKIQADDDGLHLALGLMSGTSMDGIDAALLRSDGELRVEPLAFVSESYDEAFRARLRGVLGGRADSETIETVAEELTHRHAGAVARLLETAACSASAVTVIGFHGHTILHAPEERRSWQIGDGRLLARLTGIDTVADLRGADVAAGGQGAPLAPLFHRALAEGLERPVAVLNLGGVGNVTWLGTGEEQILAFDTGPGNALLDDWALRHTGRAQDTDGALAKAGRVDAACLARLMDNPYFSQPAPKSLDRDAFPALAVIEGLSPEDGAATLSAFTVESVTAAVKQFIEPPRRWLVTGGGRHNPVIMAGLAERLGVIVQPVEAVGWQGDALEAQAFAYLALRSLKGLALSLPSTTGVPKPLTGGVLHRAA